MSNGTMTERAESAGGVVVRPQSVGMTQASQRVIAEAQAALTVAAARPRDEVDAIDRIKNTCQRLRVAESAEYEYSRGGTKISGATIKLLEVIAGSWGNIQSGFRELSRANGESVVESFAWDLETNHKKVVEFTVKHVRDTKGGSYALKDERDIYELIANMAQRRVRKCLESVIPRDVIDDALDECQKTLNAKCELTPVRIKAMADKFANEFSVTTEQIEKRIQRRLDAITQAQFLALGRVYNSLKDGLSTAKDWFESETVAEDKPSTAVESVKDALKKRKVEAPKTVAEDGEIFPFDAETINTRFAGCTSESAVNDLATSLTDAHPEQDIPISEMAADRRESLKSKPKGRDGKLPMGG